MNEMYLSVSEVNEIIKNMLDNEPRFSSIMVCGELSNYKIYPSGHHYFTLKDAESSLKCVMFRSNSSRLRFRPESGMSVTAIGRISVYPRDGVYQLYVNHMIPQGEGDLQFAFEQLKEKLEKEGLFDERHKKTLPIYPSKIALVTSSAGAAVHDMIRILGERWPATEILLVPVRVQGEEAPGEISEAIRYVNLHHLADLIITGRGGGSAEDLWAFNDESVARAIFESEIPVISAVGHEPDVTISDYVSDVRASTPSNAAEIAVPDQADIRHRVRILSNRLALSMNNIIAKRRELVLKLSSRKVLQSPYEYLNNRSLEIDRMTERLLNSMNNTIRGKKERFIRFAALLDAMSPLAVIGRGYLIAQKESKVIKSVNDTKPGDIVQLRLADGRIDCTVDTIHNEV